MSDRRREPIGTLDEALVRLVAEFDAADVEVKRFVAEHIDTIDALEALRAIRADAYYGAQRTEEAIRKLGYVVCGNGIGVRTFSALVEEREAREAKDGGNDA